MLNANQAKRFLGAASATAILAAMSCFNTSFAQDGGVNDQADDEVIVTGSRINKEGFSAPTPTTVLSDEELRLGLRPNIAAVLNDLPAFRATSTQQSSISNTNSGIYRADLRALGDDRTLVLLNKRRFIGDRDLNSVPFGLVKRVDIVTGGASAAYGSGAVAGVVNILIDDEKQGVTLDANYGISSRGDGNRLQLSASGGFEFADGRGHIVIGGEYVDDHGISTQNARKNTGRWGLITNPDPNGAAFIYAPDQASSSSSRGGLIQTGVLAGQTFNPDGTLRPFTPADRYSSDDDRALVAPLKRGNGYGKISFDVTDDFKIWADGGFSRVSSEYPFFAISTNFTIQADNVFLSDSVQTALADAGETEFTLGRVWRDFGRIDFAYARQTWHASTGFNGGVGDQWSYSGYYSHGQYRNRQTLPDLIFGDGSLNNAVDAVAHPVTGGPICRIALAVPTTTWSPLNIIGEGNASQEALNYIRADAWAVPITKLDVVGFEVNGEAFDLWAGPISVAFGGEWRHERINTTIDPISKEGGFSIINFGEQSGGYKVKEGFGEILVPLLRDVPGFQRLDVNAAGRISDYSTIGSIWSWKVGATNEIVDGLTVRGVISRDIRSGNLDELFSTNGVLLGTIADPFTNTIVPDVRTVTGGNPNVDPERSTTKTIGLVLSPIGGLNISIDYYDIIINDVIGTLQGQDIIDRCFAGNTDLCADITRDMSGVITGIRGGYQNFSRYATNGVDMEISYKFAAGEVGFGLPGDIGVRSYLNYVDSIEIDDGFSITEKVGTLGDATSFAAAGGPKWKFNNTISYDSERFGGDVRFRYVGGGVYNPALDIENNEIDPRFYVDLGLRYTFQNHGSGVTAYANVNNLFDRDPPPNSDGSIYFDVYGRYAAVGATVNF